MTINVAGKGTTVRDAFKESLQKKLAKLDRFFDENVTANVTVTVEGGRETVEVTIKASGMHFRAEKTTGDRLDSLDSVVDALFRQIVKNKTKLEKRLRKTAFAPGYENDFVGSEDSYRVVKSKRFSNKPMDVEEAILQMNLVGHNFFAFVNSQTEKVCVVYRRNDGGYGLLEPDSGLED
ncbi:MAG: ribosome-associated translation inhibitor RaiA [Oscillospiraceae bacterium]|nr:ribosome-associated translation inhibitor RaiA [Oscillospiraceae bacterium]